MKSTHYDQATVAYNAQDYPQALRGYYQCLKEDWNSFAPGDAGLVYHRIGNCLIKMKNFKEAAESYHKALQDDSYDEKTSIHVNLATTLNAIGKYAEAISYFNKALQDDSYPTPYRAYMGLGNSYWKLGKYVEAGTAYRSAALDENNPNPVKALMNLGASFTALDRPTDAIEAYLAILDFRVTGSSLNATLDKLGQAYVAARRYKEAVDTFEDALIRKHFVLSPEAQVDYQKARQALGIDVERDSRSSINFDDDAENDITDSGYARYPIRSYNESEGYGAGNVPSAADTGFFTATDAELLETGKRQLRKERKLRHTGLKVFLAVVIILIIALGTCVFAYTKGVGIPSQETVVQNFFKAYADNESIDVYWNVESEDEKDALNRLLDVVPRVSEVTIISVDSSMTDSIVLVDVVLPEGGIMHYRIVMVRDFITWKISWIEMIFASKL